MDYEVAEQEIWSQLVGKYNSLPSVDKDAAYIRYRDYASWNSRKYNVSHRVDAMVYALDPFQSNSNMDAAAEEYEEIIASGEIGIVACGHARSV